MDKKIRFAVIGSGRRWLSLDDSYFMNPDAVLVAVCDNAEGKAAAAAEYHKKKYGYDVEAYTSYEEMRKKAVYDAVIITCDPDIQVQYAVEEMSRGIHVMTEVPAAYTIEQCFDLVNAVKKTGCK